MRVIHAVVGLLISVPALLFLWVGSQTLVRWHERLLAATLTLTTIALLGTTQAERFQVSQWMFWSGEQWRTFTTTIFDERVGKTVMGVPKDPSLIEFAEGKIRAAAKVLDQHLEGRTFMVGNALTLADIDIAAPFSQVDRAKFPFEEYWNLIAWHDNLLRSVPAWAETKTEVDNRMDSFF